MSYPAVADLNGRLYILSNKKKYIYSSEYNEILTQMQKERKTVKLTKVLITQINFIYLYLVLCRRHGDKANIQFLKSLDGKKKKSFSSIWQKKQTVIGLAIWR